jgi:hypothetical protein
LLVVGYVEADGRFAVQEMIYFEGGPQKALTPLEESPLLVIVSGLNIVSAPCHPKSHKNDIYFCKSALKIAKIGNLGASGGQVSSPKCFKCG